MKSGKKKALTNRSAQGSGRVATLTPAQRLAFIEYLHTLPETHFTRSQLAQRLFEQTGLRYSQAYLPCLFRQMGLRFYKPRPRSVRRSPQAVARLIDRLRATFDGLQTLGYDLNRTVRRCGRLWLCR